MRTCFIWVVCASSALPAFHVGKHFEISLFAFHYLVPTSSVFTYTENRNANLTVKKSLPARVNIQGFTFYRAGTVNTTRLCLKVAMKMSLPITYPKRLYHQWRSSQQLSAIIVPRLKFVRQGQRKCQGCRRNRVHRTSSGRESKRTRIPQARRCPSDPLTHIYRTSSSFEHPPRRTCSFLDRCHVESIRGCFE